MAPCKFKSTPQFDIHLKRASRCQVLAHEPHTRIELADNPGICSAVPLQVTVPAVAAVAAYANARFLAYYDLELLRAIIPTVLGGAWKRYRDRVNLFYQLENLATAKSSENRVFLRFEDRAYTYAQAYDTVLRYANWLRDRRGVRRGDLVGLDFQNTDTFIFLFLATWAIGASPALLNHNLTGNPLIHCVKKSTARLVLVDPVVASNVTEEVRSGLEGVNFEAVTPEIEQEMLAMDNVRPPDELRSGFKDEDMAMLIYTSGTTGLPKAAIISWAKAATVANFTFRWLGTQVNDVYYTVRLSQRVPRSLQLTLLLFRLCLFTTAQPCCWASPIHLRQELPLP